MLNMIAVAALSTGDASLLTGQVTSALQDAKILVLRTGQHPVTGWLKAQGIAYETLDALYEQSADFDTFNRAAVNRILTLSERSAVTYAVSDVRTDATVAALRQAISEPSRLILLPGVSHAERCLSLLGFPTAGIRLYAAEDYRKARVSPGEPLLLSELHSRECAGECKLNLMRMLPDDTRLSFFTGSSDGALQVSSVSLFELDRQPAYNHLTACYVPAMPLLARERHDLDDLVAVMEQLRAPGGCPWDREQTHESLLTNLLEECYEFIGAVRDGDSDHMYDELGDVLLQVVFHAQIAHEHGDFSMDDVTTAITRKMIERHTHIFGSAHAETAEQVVDNWEAIKRSQRGIRTVSEAMEDISNGLSSLMRADKVQHKAAKVGFDFPDALSALQKVHEEADEIAECLQNNDDPELELGDLFFSAVNVCRLCKKNPDIALYAATNKFLNRFRNMENSIQKAGKSIEHLTLSEMDVYWEAEKQE